MMLWIYKDVMDSHPILLHGFTRTYLGTGDEQSSSFETPASGAQFSGQWAAQQAVGDELRSSLAELIDPTGNR